MLLQSLLYGCHLYLLGSSLDHRRYNSMIAFIHSVSDNAFAEFVVWMPFIFAWFKPDKRGNANSYYHRQANFWAMYDTTGGRW